MIKLDALAEVMWTINPNPDGVEMLGRLRRVLGECYYPDGTLRETVQVKDMVDALEETR